MMGSRTRLLLCLLLVPVLAACPQNLSVSVVEPATVDDLRFGISNYTGEAEAGRVFQFSVVELGALGGPGRTTVLWTVTAGPEHRIGAELAEIRYGDLPAGFVTEVGPHPLVPGGRYSATGGVEFRVAPDGSVSALDPDTLSDRYVQAGLTRDDFLPYWEGLQAALASADAEAVARAAHYPLEVVTPDSIRKVPDPEALIDDFDEIFPAELRARIAEARQEDLIVTSPAILADLGRIRIGAVCKPEDRSRCAPAVYRVERFPPS
jgi:hypothetical protein